MVDLDVSAETPTELIPKMGEFPVSNSAYYKQLIMTEAASGSAEGEVLDKPLDPFSEPDPLDARPTSGVLLTFEQGWYQEGLALGELRKSLCLAPGEVTKLAVVDWRRDVRSSETASRTDTERLRAATEDDTAAAQVQRAVGTETRTGMSLTSGSSSHVEGSASYSGLIAGGSVSGGSSSHRGFAASSSTGSRAVASAATKDVQRRTEQIAQSARSTRATQIREVSEGESQQTTTRVVANYNHAHALTMQYYEVLQIYSLRTQVVRADRCIFIPMEQLVFDRDGLLAASDATIELLRDVLQDYGAVKLDEMVGNFHAVAPDLDEEIARLGDERERLQGQVEEIGRTVARAQGAVRAATSKLAVAEQAQQRVLQNFDLFTDAPALAEAVAAVTAAAAETAAAQVAATTAVATGNLRRQALEAQIESIGTDVAAKREALAAHERMFGLLDQHRVLLNQQMWMRIDKHTWHAKLAGKTFGHGEYAGQEIGGLIDPAPIGYFGSYVAFTWDFPRDAADEAEEYERLFTRRSSTRTSVALPTEGVFAEAVLGQANSAEKIDITRFWNWQDSPIPILPPNMGTVDTGSRARDVAAPAPLAFGPALVALRDLGVTPDVSDEQILGALQTSLGADQGALLAAATTAGINASDNAADGAGRAGQRVVDGMKNLQDFTVGLANSEVGKIAASALAAKTGGISAVGGLLSAAGKSAAVPRPAADEDGSDDGDAPDGATPSGLA